METNKKKSSIACNIDDPNYRKAVEAMYEDYICRALQYQVAEGEEVDIKKAIVIAEQLAVEDNNFEAAITFRDAQITKIK